MLACVPSNDSAEFLTGPGSGWAFLRTTQVIWLVVGEATMTPGDTHGSITSVVVSHARAVGAVDRNVFVVCTNSVTMGVGVVDEPPLKHLVIAGFNAGH